MLVPIGIAIIGISIQSVGYVLQKIGISEFSSSFREFLRKKNFRIWVIGTIFAFFGALLFFLALPLSSISIIQPIIGIGPAIVALFGFFILKTHLHKNEVLGIALSVFGILLLSFELNPNVSSLQVDELDFLMIAIIIISLTVILSNILFRLEIYDLGIEEGIISGVFGGFSSIFGKIGFAQLFDFELHWAIFALIITQTTSFILFQKGIHQGKMEKVVSIFTSTAILMPVLIGLIFFGETLNAINILGVIIILIGSILLTKQYSSLIA